MRITLADYADPALAVQLAKLDDQEADYLDERAHSDHPMTDVQRHDMERQYDFRARLQDQLAELANEPDTARWHHTAAFTCRGARQLYARSTQSTLVRLASETP